MRKDRANIKVKGGKDKEERKERRKRRGNRILFEVKSQTHFKV
jgi:hypothetical protein